MEYVILLLLFLIALFSVPAVLHICRKLLRTDLPLPLTALAYLDTENDLKERLEALSLQLTWTDSALVQSIWLVDGTPDGALLPICQEFCMLHPEFHYCRAGDALKILSHF